MDDVDELEEEEEEEDSVGRRPSYDGPPLRGARRSAARDGRLCDECGGLNVPAGWLHADWIRYVPDPTTWAEGYQGLVLCALCYAELAERQDGAEAALAILKQVYRGDQERRVRRTERDREARASAARSGSEPR